MDSPSLLIPFILLLFNAKRGYIGRLSDFRYAWHASKIELDEVLDRHVWLLTDTMVMPSGEENRRPPFESSRTNADRGSVARVERLKALGVEEVWVSFKMPLLVFLFPAVLPLVLIGDPTTLLVFWLN